MPTPPEITDPDDPIQDDQWASEIERRMENVRTGKSKLIPAEEVFRKAEDLLR
jgi:putative addiction module component (TIGR02574 family)